MCACHGATEPEKNTEPYFNVCKRLLDNEAHVDATNDVGHWGLHLACYSGLDAIVELLIARQANVNKSDKNGDSPLSWACRGATETEGNTEHYFNVCNRLLDNGAYVDATNNEGQCGLQFACFCGLDRLVELLIAKEANVDRKDKAGRSPVMCACHGASEPESSIEHFINICRLLLENNADINATNDNGKSVLYLACLFGLDRLVELLIENQANVNNSGRRQ